jgi:hypothetical protein
MLLYCMPPIDDLGVLPETVSIGQPAAERPAEGRVSSIVPMANRGPLPAFLHPGTRGPVL